MALHPRDNVDRYNLSRKGGRGLTSFEDTVDALIQQLKHYIEKSRGRLITAIRNNTDITKTNRTAITRKQNGKKNNCIDILSHKQAKSHTGKRGRG